METPSSNHVMAPCFAAYSTLGVLHSCVCCGSASNEAMKQPAGTTCWFAVETQYPLRSSATAQFMHICQVRRVLEYRRSATRRASIYPLLGLATSTRYSRGPTTPHAATPSHLGGPGLGTPAPGCTAMLPHRCDPCCHGYAASSPTTSRVPPQTLPIGVAWVWGAQTPAPASAMSCGTPVAPATWRDKPL